MTTETVKYVIEAEDRATPVWQNFRKGVASTGSQLASSAKEAKATSQSFVLLANAAGNVVPGLGGVASAAVELHGVLGKVQGASQAAGAALVLLKAGAVAGLSVAVYEGVTALWKYIDGWDALQAKLDASRDSLDFTTKNLLKLKDVKFSNFLKDIQAFESLDGQERMLGNFEFSAGGELRDLQKKIGLLKEASANSSLFAEERKDELAALEAQQAALLRQLDTVKQLRTDNARQQKINDMKADEAHAEAMKKKAKEVSDEWRKAEKEQVGMFKASLQEQLKKQEAVSSHFTDIKQQLIALRDGEAAARAFSLEQSGIEGGTASQIARMEEQLRQAQAGQEVKTNTASESRLLSGRVEMDAARQTANATKRVRELTEQIWKQNEMMLAKQTEIAKNTANQLETLR